MRLLKAIVTAFDVRDVLFALGLALFAAGLAQISLTCALIGSGSILLLAALKG